MRYLVILFVFINVQSLKAQITKDTLANVSDPQSILIDDILLEKPSRLLTSKGVYIVNYIANNFNYPDVALEEEITGTIIIDFIVEKDGSVKEAIAISKLCNACDAEAIRVIKSTTYQPFIVNNEPQRIRYRIPVRMMLE